ncbi:MULTISPECIES: DUF1523 family protein [unclassified Meridianimarinicoccus]|uniref:DUF1523 family protein n=1 Tax=unclassified Meridianimarinicoccus TaxID=2923344 RepID=UPI0018692833|nr:DUF1523 family protein [Fluviibacterium sp. MJW13]
MVYVKWIFWGLMVLLLGGFLHYTLPRHDTLRIVETEVRRVEVGEGSLFWGSSEPGAMTAGNRDVKFISGVRESGRTKVFRNEDTGWGWPPYMKFNSADLQARAADLTSSQDAPRWILVKSYGWRNQLLSVFPNVLSLKEVSGPDHRVIPVFNILVLTGLAALVLVIRAFVKRFWANRVDPVVEDVASAFDAADDHVDAAGRRFRGRREKFREWWVETFGG